mgnify:FL=1
MLSLILVLLQLALLQIVLLQLFVHNYYFHFDYLPLQEIARELSNAFHVKIKITDEDIKDFRIRAHFTEGESLDQMLDLLQPAGNFSYSKTNDTILIHSKLN